MAKTSYDHELAGRIEQARLKAETSKADIEKLCKQALLAGFYGICVPPWYVTFAKQQLEKAKPLAEGVILPKLVTVVGFPLGYNILPVKADETRAALSEGAQEIDMVINIGALKSGSFNYVKDEIQTVVTLCRLQNGLAKVIIEASLLTEEEIKKVCEICTEIGVAFVKTSTGFNGHVTSVKEVKMLRELLPEKIKIKAAGGIKTRKDALALIEAGADRIGTSSGMDIVKIGK